ncbi:hypothetical protein DQ04_00201130 [Trypanosoma grayi]|uniref:hypothetical protein n=1 Tax=Trypanosoma grayi TaxID=71804 RepID=UPI0004F411B1|nr:hypothetical protein DQ04_00201130 [Trypanosoma grayi]KEG15060.1 hypothetical protein DQ04_00201130 [Trypanosoma grayi]
MGCAFSGGAARRGSGLFRGRKGHNPHPKGHSVSRRRRIYKRRPRANGKRVGHFSRRARARHPLLGCNAGPMPRCIVVLARCRESRVARQACRRKLGWGALRIRVCSAAVVHTMAKDSAHSDALDREGAAIDRALQDHKVGATWPRRVIPRMAFPEVRT